MPFSQIATEASYFQLGLEAGIVSESEAREWAFRVIESLDDPPYEVIVVAESHGLHSVRDALASVIGERDDQQVGSWLLGRVGALLANSELTPREAAKKAMQVSMSSGLDQSTYYAFDALEDDMYLSETEQYGTLEECIAALRLELEPHKPFVLVKHNNSLQGRRP